MIQVAVNFLQKGDHWLVVSLKTLDNNMGQVLAVFGEETCSLEMLSLIFKLNFTCLELRFMCLPTHIMKNSNKDSALSAGLSICTLVRSIESGCNPFFLFSLSTKLLATKFELSNANSS